jgi:glycerol-1-phosphate dehydrogenase [NAD(P)+]
MPWKAASRFWFKEAMEINSIHFYCGEAAIDRLLEFCQANNLRTFSLVCDSNTLRILGKEVEAKLMEQGLEVCTIVLEGDSVIADEQYLGQVFFKADGKPSTYLAVGSGTITDITRFCSHRSRNPFISIPTAPSVDGYASIISALVIQGLKVSAWAQPPLAIFAPIRTLCEAPPAMIAAGFGDMLGKFTALADWKLDHILWEQPYQPAIADRVERALRMCVDHIEEIWQGKEEGISLLIEGLVESGLGMLENGNSRPASGSEHHLSHYWEMKLLRLKKPAVLHGMKVGIGTLFISERYEQIRRLNLPEVKKRLQDRILPDRETEISTIEAGYGPISPGIIAVQQRFLNLKPSEFDRLKEKILFNWDEIHQAASEVPPPDTIRGLLERLQAPTTLTSIGMNPDDKQEALLYSHYLRDQFTVSKLGRILDLW